MRSHLIALAALLALLAGAPAALASGRDVIDDCTDDEVLSKSYTQKEYRDALAKLPADADQYGNCRDIIARAQDGAATKGGSGKPGASTAAPADAGTAGGHSPSATAQPAAAKDPLAAATDADRDAVDEAARDGATAASGPGNPLAGTVGTAPRAGVSDLPTPILVLLGLLLAGALALAAVRIRSLVNSRRA